MELFLSVIILLLFIPHQVDCTCETGVRTCDWQSWGFWSPCTSSCAGWRTRRRDMCCGIHVPDCIDKCHRPNTSVETEPCEIHCPNGGSYLDGICHCPPLRYGICCERNESVFRGPCSRPCTYTNWPSWGACSRTCGCGTRTRWRFVCCVGHLNSTACFDDCKMYDITDQRQCTSPCATSPTSCDLCSWKRWEAWSSCNRKCGGGQRSRYRSPCCCPDQGIDDCLFDCKLLESDRKEEEPCGENCYNNGSYVHRGCACVVGYRGECCETELTDSNCTKCSLSLWLSWSPCSKTCGRGQRTRVRNPCCRIGQDTEDCVRQCALNKDMLTQEEDCTEMCCGSTVEGYIFSGIGSAAAAVIVTSLVWCICQKMKKENTRTDHVYESPAFSGSSKRGLEIPTGNPMYVGANVGASVVPDEEHYEKLEIK